MATIKLGVTSKSDEITTKNPISNVNHVSNRE
jgi:hypothetical protein